MAFTYGFYNSREHDRVYSAEDFSSIFDGIIADGVFHIIPIGGDLANNDQMRVTPNGAMTVSVGRGKAWFNHTWSTNDTPYALQLEASHGVYDRYDAIVLEVRSNVEYRQNSLKVLTGTASANPTKPVLSNIKGFYQHALAYVLVHAGATQIEPEDIEDMVGTLETPYARAISDDVALRIANSLTIPADQDGFILDARQGKVLDDKKVDKANIANNLTTTASGKVLDARQGKVLQNSISAINSQLSSGNIKFQFGVTSDGKYGYKKAGADTVYPFSSGNLKKILSIRSEDDEDEIKWGSTKPDINNFFFVISSISVRINRQEMYKNANLTMSNVTLNPDSSWITAIAPSISLVQEGDIWYVVAKGFKSHEYTMSTGETFLVFEGTGGPRLDNKSITLTVKVWGDVYYKEQ